MAASNAPAPPPASVFAHSLPGAPIASWEALADHLSEVGAMAAEFAGVFGCAEAARVAGLLHDIGKCSAAFQAYLRGGGARGPDHSTAGAREAALAYPPPLGRMLAAAIAGHHAGLADPDALAFRLDGKVLEAYDGWRDHVGALPGLARLAPTMPARPNAAAGFSAAFLTRMLFSCLVDADGLATERFFAAGEGRDASRGGFLDLPTLRDRLRLHMASRVADAAPNAVNRLRAEVLAHAAARAALPPGLFTLTVPTGGGKTLASLSFALEHAVRHGLRRVIFVIPFTSIVEQTATVFRAALATDHDVLEHHASFDWEGTRTASDDSEGPDGRDKLRRASENWDVPIVVTTAVQFFESLFANRRSRCRKLHNVAGSVVVLDEAQTLPVRLLRPTLAALEELAANYRTSVVVCTATQPAWRRIDGALPRSVPPSGLDIDDARELAPDPPRLFTALRRVTVERVAEPVGDGVLAARFAEQPQMLCIVNNRRHARELHDAIADLPGAIHLTTLMCARHRQTVLAEARVDLAAGRPVRLVATSLIEAGVDISFPEVWRAVAGLDQINQAAGRCNREGGPVLGRVVVFEPATATAPASLRAFWQAARQAVRAYPDALLSPEAVRRYFHELYAGAGVAALDAPMLDGKCWPILPALRERAREADFPFASIAAAYRLIDDAMAPVVVPYDVESAAVMRAVAAASAPPQSLLRRLQPYLVGIPQDARRTWLAAGVLRPVHRALGDSLLRFEDLAHYRKATGVDLSDPRYRDAEANVV